MPTELTTELIRFANTVADQGVELSATSLRQEKILRSSLRLGRKLGFEEPHAVQVAVLAMKLFRSLAHLHHLPEADGDYLLAGALLHDIGASVDFRSHHKHSRDIILKSALEPFSAKERLIAANIARYHRKSAPQEDHTHFQPLSPKNRRMVSVLSSLLRLADGLDRLHISRIRKLSVQVQGDTLLLLVSPPGSYETERWAVEKKANLFTGLFRLKIQIKDF
jgi:exopolyphosphatase/guanosine-5'-triphosphate,3'-diphosphate pyrophosphatase